MRHQLYLIIDCKVANLHCHGDEIDSAVQFILLKLLFQVYVLFADSAKHNTLHHHDVMHAQTKRIDLPVTDYSLSLPDKEDEAKEVDEKLQHHRRDCVEVEYVW